MSITEEQLARAGVVCFGGEDWWYHNRAHCDMQLMRQYARFAPVLYVNSVVMRKPNIAEGAMFWRRVRRKLRSIARGLVRAEPNFFVYSPVTAPVHHLPGARSLNQLFLRMQMRLAIRRAGLRKPLVWVNCPAACGAALALKRTALVYQRTDRYEDYPGVDREQIGIYDRTLKQNADLTFYSSESLYEAEKDQCRKAAYVEHGVDNERFASAENDPQTPADLQNIKRPIVGFFGGIDKHTFDVRLMADVIERMPEASFVFVGNASVGCESLSKNANAHLLGKRSYEEIPHYGKCFDVCIMPWNQNDWIKACNPIKLKEYLALGKPVVSTPFPELEHYNGVVRSAKSADEFAAAIRESLAQSDPELPARRRERVREHSWRSKAQQILELI